jgi:hypothetical protein
MRGISVAAPARHSTTTSGTIPAIVSNAASPAAGRRRSQSVTARHARGRGRGERGQGDARGDGEAHESARDAREVLGETIGDREVLGEWRGAQEDGEKHERRDRTAGGPGIEGGWRGHEGCETEEA